MSRNYRSKGLNEFFFCMGPLWRLHARIRHIRESGKDISSIISPDWSPITPCDIPIIPQEELTPWLPISKPNYINNLSKWDRDFWMTEEISSVYNGRRLLRNIYDTFMCRNEKQFYQDFCPIRWSLNNDYALLNTGLERFKAEDEIFITVGNFALSEECPQEFIKKEAKKLNIKVIYPYSPRLILWARYDFLRRSDAGLSMIRVYKSLSKEYMLRQGIPYFKQTTI